MSILGTSCQYHGLTFVGVSRDVIVVGLMVRNYLACGGLHFRSGRLQEFGSSDTA